MGQLTSMPVVRQIETERADLYAFDLVGPVSAADVENFYGLLEAAYALHPAIDVLVRRTGQDQRDAADASPATLNEGKAHAGEHVRRCALVGNTRALPEIQRFFASSVEVRHFDEKDEAAAWDWIGGQPAEIA